MDKLIRKANVFFRDGDFEKALESYKEAAAIYDTKLYDLNIKICQNKLRVKSRERLPNSRFPHAEIRSLNSQIKNTRLFENANATKDSKICLIRIIGNELPGLHSDNQAIENLRFILENEVSHERVDKFFILNRIVSREKRDQLKSILRKHKSKFVEIVFNPEEYRDIDEYHQDLPDQSYWMNKNANSWELLCIEVAKRKLRNKYLMNNNGARNFAIEFGFSRNYDWVFPLDGNCFFSKPQLLELCHSVDRVSARVDYLVIPMERCTSNHPNLAYQTSSFANEEPQIAFKKTSLLRFDDKRVYGNQPKVDLLKRLGVAGVWDEWIKEYPWKEFTIEKEDIGGREWCKVSSVFRLYSGNKSAALDSSLRAKSRASAIIQFCDEVTRFCHEVVSSKSKIDFLHYKQCKDAQNREDNYATDLNSYFDKIYLVSLDSDIEKRLRTKSILDAVGLESEWFSAVNGYNKPFVDWYREYAKQEVGKLKHFVEFNDYELSKGSKLIESPGAVGYIETYCNIIKDAKSKGYKRILIFEDDIVLCHNFKARLKKFINSIEADWRILLLGASQYGWSSFNMESSLKCSYYLPRIHDTKGSFAIAFDHRIFDEILEEQTYREAPFENLPLGVLYERHLGKCFVAFPNLVMPDVSSSVIRGGRNQYEHSNRVKWFVNDFNYPLLKTKVGLISSDISAFKYLSNHKLENFPVNLNFYIMTKNGLMPVHNFDSQSRGSSCISPHYDGITLSNDYNYEIQSGFYIGEEALISELHKLIVDQQPSVILKEIFNCKGTVIPKRVSVILPTYKRPDFLKNAACSVLKQDYDDIELLIVDDNGSDSEYSDETSIIVKELTQDFPERKIVYIKHAENANGAAARNSGVIRSSGEYICFIDDDDIYLPGRISESVRTLELTNVDVGATYCGFIGWNSTEEDNNRFKEGDLTKDILLLDYKNHYLHTNTATYKRDAVFYINGFDISYRRHQDLEFNLRFFHTFLTTVTRGIHVSLSPQKSEVNNKVYGVEMFLLKDKFLSDFREKIKHFGDDIANEIYSRHWAEVLKYAKDRTELLDYISGLYDNGAVQILKLSR